MKDRTKYLLSQIRNISPHVSATLSILKAIRSKIEYNLRIKNRIGKFCPEGFRGVMLLGSAGTGKTSLMKKIYEGLRLDVMDPGSGRAKGTWISAGIGTAKGKFELLLDNPDNIIFIDELDINSKDDQKIFKQIISGWLIYLKHDSVVPVEFKGVVIGATNGIKLTKDESHLIAMIDRFSIVNVAHLANDNAESYFNRVARTHYDNLDNFDKVAKTDQIDIDWMIIQQNLAVTDRTDLTDIELNSIKKRWLLKSKECLEERALTRQCADYIDCFLFCKRFFGTLDFGIFNIAVALANESVITNKALVVRFTPLERVIYDTIHNSGEQVTTIERIINNCDSVGLTFVERHIYRSLETLLLNRLINRIKKGVYTTRQVECGVIKEEIEMLPNETKALLRLV